VAASLGDFSYGLQGLWIEGSKIAHTVEGTNMAGNFKYLWPALVRIGDYHFPYARLCSPTCFLPRGRTAALLLRPARARDKLPSKVWGIPVPGREEL
jgi:hypothetical protein